VARQPGISFSISFQHPFNRAGWRTSNDMAGKMPDKSKYHRLGASGGPGCSVGILDVEFSGPNSDRIPAELLDGGPNSTELELLRTVASRLGVKWGHDEFGWWAAVEKSKVTDWTVWRQDDNGQKYVIQTNLNETDAGLLVAELEASAHKQSYWSARD
jgi:hypothetical protein